MGSESSSRVPVPEKYVIDEDLPCPECAYNLRGLTVPRCPECGFRFEWSDLPELRENRQQDGGRIAVSLALLPVAAKRVLLGCLAGKLVVAVPWLYLARYLTSA